MIRCVPVASRAAVLIAARDELGLSTRDETLREFNKQDDASRQILDIQTTALVRDKYVVTLQHGPAVARTVLWHKEIALPSDSIDYLKLIETAEQLARTELIDVLRKAGYPNESTSPSATLTRLTKLHEKLLGRMTFPSQFAVVRQVAFQQPDRLRGHQVRRLRRLGRPVQRRRPFADR